MDLSIQTNINDTEIIRADLSQHDLEIFKTEHSEDFNLNRSALHFDIVELKSFDIHLGYLMYNLEDKQYWYSTINFIHMNRLEHTYLPFISFFAAKSSSAINILTSSSLIHFFTLSIICSS